MAMLRLVFSSTILVNFIAHTIADSSTNACADECGLRVMSQCLASQSTKQSSGERTVGGIGHSRAARTQAGDDSESKQCFFHKILIVSCFL